MVVSGKRLGPLDRRGHYRANPHSGNGRTDGCNFHRLVYSLRIGYRPCYQLGAIRLACDGRGNYCMVS